MVGSVEPRGVALFANNFLFEFRIDPIEDEDFASVLVDYDDVYAKSEVVWGTLYLN